MVKFWFCSLGCLIISVVDARTFRIPDKLLFLFFCISLAFDHSLDGIAGRLLAAALCLIVFYAVYRFSRGLGFGDVKYAALLGYLAGTENLRLFFGFTAAGSLLVYLGGIILLRWKSTARLPFAPFMSLGVMAALFVRLYGDCP